MPHYKDNVKAVIGDVVVGNAINAGAIVGVVVGISVNQDKCNLIIAYAFKSVHNGSSCPELNLKSHTEIMNEIAFGQRRKIMAVDSHLMTGGSISGDSIFVSTHTLHRLMDFEIDYGNAEEFEKVIDNSLNDVKNKVVTKEMVDRFLNWRLPKSVRPDACVLMPDYPHRIGTNLLTAAEAEEMLEHVLGSSRKTASPSMPAV